jgi:adenylate kinase
MRVVLLAPPGSGKGTQGTRMADRYGVPHISSGDLFRAEVAKASAIGEQVRSYPASGDLVPDELVIELVLERLADDDLAAGFVLDGFPRTVAQAEALGRRLDELGGPLDAVVALQVGEPEPRRRLDDGLQEAIRVLLRVREAHPVQLHEAGVAADVRDQEQGAHRAILEPP